MKKFLLLCITLCMVTTSAFSEETIRVWLNVGFSDCGYIRAEPSQNSEKIAIWWSHDSVREFKHIEILDNGWLKISMNQKNEKGETVFGYIASWIVSFEQPCDKDGRIIGDGRVRFRKIPTSDGEVIQFLNLETLVKIKASIPGWTKINYDDKTGWIMTKYIERLEN